KERLCRQERLIPFLLEPRSYPHRPAGVRMVQTHASLVFIAPPYVYKLKKAVDFGFLDFSTLEKRRHFCEREVELNRRLSSGVYLGVESIHESEAGFEFGGDGRVVEYVVRMRKLTDRNFLDRRLARGEVGPAELDRIVAALKEFYLSQEPTDQIEQKGR
ncbi:MAG: phosphotransferase, partial [Akkermansiaceae bacterium]|nr:phosphotransferase [Akkermansiaceae bacterium]